MAEKWDGIQWSSLRHAFGDAGDVPEALRALNSDDPDTQDQALEQLAGSIFHQGDVYDATLAAWPFLVERMVSGALDDERGALLLLNMGTTAFWATLSDERTEEEKEEDEESGSALAEPNEARKVVDAAFPKLLALFDAAGPRTKSALVNLCTQDPQSGRKHRPLLEKARAEAKKDETMRALADLALAATREDDVALQSALESIYDAIPEAAERAGDEDAPLHARAAMASEDALIAVLTG